MKKTIWSQGDIEYEIGYGLGNWAESKESRHLEKGDTRVIKGLLMCVYSAEYGFFNSIYKWVPVDENFNTFENRRTWAAK